MSAPPPDITGLLYGPRARQVPRPGPAPADLRNLSNPARERARRFVAALNEIVGNYTDEDLLEKDFDLVWSDLLRVTAARHGLRTEDADQLRPRPTEQAETATYARLRDAPLRSRDGLGVVLSAGRTYTLLVPD